MGVAGRARQRWQTAAEELQAGPRQQLMHHASHLCWVCVVGASRVQLCVLLHLPVMRPSVTLERKLAASVLH